ncbi:SAM-dependent methyltransferase [Lentzea sp. NBRC 105346]|uniref:SAM-dependent methyltransferase n=1 Tax=Lentzea sp. NBRC 105346 TaxID=3032205 RepID=UPI002555052E|nr:SAM-dependent methyltransferase [Lentzea sp. NBRC 105346]
MEQLNWVPSSVDVTKPSVARMYDYFLGGSHNFEADRAAAKAVEQFAPGAATGAQSNRSFLRRAVRTLRAAGVSQFLDLGSGIPTVGNVHEIAQQDDPTARVVYVDFEPVAVSHANLLLAENDYACAIQADLRSPSTVLTQSNLLDFTKPVGVLMVAALHFVPDSDDPYSVVETYLDACVPGSYLVLSHGTMDGYDPEDNGADQVSAIYKRTGNPVTPRTHAEVSRFFTGLSLIEPGVVPVNEWRPDADADFVGIYAGVARKDS